MTKFVLDENATRLSTSTKHIPTGSLTVGAKLESEGTAIVLASGMPKLKQQHT
jgi:hypothetical protein